MTSRVVKSADAKQGEPAHVITPNGPRPKPRTDQPPLERIIEYCRAELQTAHGKQRRHLLHILDIAEGRE